jgi:hypothetical protein
MAINTWSLRGQLVGAVYDVMCGGKRARAWSNTVKRHGHPEITAKGSALPTQRSKRTKR